MMSLPLASLQQRPANAGFFDFIGGDIIDDVINQQDPFKKDNGSDESGEDKTIGDKNVYKNVSIKDLNEGVKVLNSLLKKNYNKALDLLSKLLGKEGSLDADKTGAILAEKNRSENPAIPADVKGNKASSDGVSVEEVILLPPNSPEAIAENQRRINAARNQTPKLLSKIVTSDEGIEAITQQDVAKDTSLQRTLTSIDSMATIAETSADSASFSDALAKESDALAKQAQGRKATQDVVKDLSGIMAKGVYATSAVSDQLLRQAEGNNAIAASLHSLNEQQSIQTEKLTTLSLLNAASNTQLGNILSVDMAEQQRERSKVNGMYKAAYNANGAYWLPSLKEDQ